MHVPHVGLVHVFSLITKKRIDRLTARIPALVGVSPIYKEEKTSRSSLRISTGIPLLATLSSAQVRSRRQPSFELQLWVSLELSIDYSESIRAVKHEIIEMRLSCTESGK